MMESANLNLSMLSSALVSAVSNYAEPSGSAGLLARKKIINAAKAIIREVQEPAEMPFEYSVQMGEMAALRQLMDMRVFDNIPDTGSISYKELAAKVGAEEPFVRRLAWMLVATGVLEQVGESSVAHTKFSRIYVGQNAQGQFFQIMFDECLVAYARWPDYFRKYGYKEPRDAVDAPHPFAYGQHDKNFWDALSTVPKRLEAFNISMGTLDEMLPITGMFDFSYVMKHASSVPEDIPLVVDVGGGKGQALKRILAECPDIPPSRLVLQDRPDVIEEKIRLDEPELRGVKKMAHDFFKPQPIKGALIYYVRRIMHDWSDDVNRIILSHLADAMNDSNPNSRILITEQIMPNPPTSLPAQTDLCVMNLSGKERTKKDWLALVAPVGLRVAEFWETLGTEVAVIECVKAN